MNRDPAAGRNDPCPCGSGLKYKKCCLGRQNLGPPTSGTAGVFAEIRQALQGRQFSSLENAGLSGTASCSSATRRPWMTSTACRRSGCTGFLYSPSILRKWWVLALSPLIHRRRSSPVRPPGGGHRREGSEADRKATCRVISVGRRRQHTGRRSGPRRRAVCSHRQGRRFLPPAHGWLRGCPGLFEIPRPIHPQPGMWHAAGRSWPVRHLPPFVALLRTRFQLGLPGWVS